MKVYILVAMLFYVANGVNDAVTSDGTPRKAVPSHVGFISFLIQASLAAWGAYYLL